MTKETNTSEGPKRSSVSELGQFVHLTSTSSGDVIYRGQSARWPLVPRIGRLLLPSHDFEYTERQMIAEFEREAPSFSAWMSRDPWDSLAVAQHHGLATRLLDWTRNPLVALWFAVREPPKFDCAVVWVLETKLVDVVADGVGTTPFLISQTCVFRPRHVTPRIRAQDALFTVHKRVRDASSDGRFIPLDENRDYQHFLHAIEITAGKCPVVHEELRRCGIHAASVFPDLDGLARRIEADYVPALARLEEGGAGRKLD
jgi:hypothetical protein